MLVSNLQVALFVLAPGAAESLESRANIDGNMAWQGIAKSVKYTRNALYIGIALTALATFSMCFAESVEKKIICGSLIGLGLTLVAWSAKKLYDEAGEIRRIFNSLLGVKSSDAPPVESMDMDEEFDPIA